MMGSSPNGIVFFHTHQSTKSTDGFLIYYHQTGIHWPSEQSRKDVRVTPKVYLWVSNINIVHRLDVLNVNTVARFPLPWYHALPTLPKR